MSTDEQTGQGSAFEKCGNPRCGKPKWKHTAKEAEFCKAVVKRGK